MTKRLSTQKKWQKKKENDAEFFKANPVLGKVLADAKECKRCAAEHRQLAEWLRELKERKEKDVPDMNVGDSISMEAAIDAIEFGITYAKAINKETGEVKELFQVSNDELRKAADRIKQLPSAQPEETCGSCLYRGLGWHEEPCDSCTVGGESYKRRTEQK